MTFAARIKPHDPRKGQVGRSYTHIGLNRRFVEGQIYRDLTEQEAAVLRGIQQPKAGRGALFDVGTAEEMEQILANEAADKLGVSRTVAPAIVPPPKLAAPAAPVAVPIEQLEHTDAAGVRVRHTQDAPAPPPPPAPAPAAQGARPKKAGGK